MFPMDPYIRTACGTDSKVFFSAHGIESKDLVPKLIGSSIYKLESVSQIAFQDFLD